MKCWHGWHGSPPSFGGSFHSLRAAQHPRTPYVIRTSNEEDAERRGVRKEEEISAKQALESPAVQGRVYRPHWTHSHLLIFSLFLVFPPLSSSARIKTCRKAFRRRSALHENDSSANSGKRRDRTAVAPGNNVNHPDPSVSSVVSLLSLLSPPSPTNLSALLFFLIFSEEDFRVVTIELLSPWQKMCES